MVAESDGPDDEALLANVLASERNCVLKPRVCRFKTDDAVVFVIEQNGCIRFAEFFPRLAVQSYDAGRVDRGSQAAAPDLGYLSKFTPLY